MGRGFLQLLDAVLLVLGTIKHALSSACDPSTDNAANALVTAAAVATTTEVRVQGVAALTVLVGFFFFFFGQSLSDQDARLAVLAKRLVDGSAV